jgi:hypothetical protein
MNATYVGRNFLLNGIQDKLDRFVLGGMTLKEALVRNQRIEFGELTVPLRRGVASHVE